MQSCFLACMRQCPEWESDAFYSLVCIPQHPEREPAFFAVYVLQWSEWESKPVFVFCTLSEPNGNQIKSNQSLFLTSFVHYLTSFVYLSTICRSEIFIVVFGILSGMSVRLFKGFPSLQEIECTTGNLKAEVNVFSLKLFTVPENGMLAHANPVKNECVTFEEYSSCEIDSSDTRNSRLRVLVSDLREGERRKYGCTASSFGPFGETNVARWSLVVKRNSEYGNEDVSFGNIHF